MRAAGLAIPALLLGNGGQRDASCEEPSNLPSAEHAAWLLVGMSRDTPYNAPPAADCPRPLKRPSPSPSSSFRRPKQPCSGSPTSGQPAPSQSGRRAPSPAPPCTPAKLPEPKVFFPLPQCMGDAPTSSQPPTLSVLPILEQLRLPASAVPAVNGAALPLFSAASVAAAAAQTFSPGYDALLAALLASGGASLAFSAAGGLCERFTTAINNAPAVSEFGAAAESAAGSPLPTVGGVNGGAATDDSSWASSDVAGAGSSTSSVTATVCLPPKAAHKQQEEACGSGASAADTAYALFHALPRPMPERDLGEGDDDGTGTARICALCGNACSLKYPRAVRDASGARIGYKCHSCHGRQQRRDKKASKRSR